MSLKPAWYPKDAKQFAEQVLAHAEPCTAELRCLPYLRALVSMLNKRGVRGVNPLEYEAWLHAYKGCFAMTPLLLASDPAQDEARFYSAIVVLLEGVLRQQAECLPLALELVGGRVELARAVAAMELETVKAAAAEASASPPGTGTLLGELDTCDRIETATFSVPIPLAAEAEPHGCIDCFIVPRPLRELVELYLMWTRREGWQVDTRGGNDEHVAWLTVSRAGQRVELKLALWPAGGVAVFIELPGATAARRISARDA